MPTKRERKAYTRNERKELILLCFIVDIQRGGTGELTVADLAREMHVTPQTKLRMMVLELVDEGYLTVRKEPLTAGGAVGFKAWYSLKEMAIRRIPYEKQQKRTVTINRKGQKAGQLEIRS